MKTNIDQLMREADVEALLVSGSAAHNPYKTYFTGLVHVTSGYLLKQVGKAPVLFHRSMERDEAARTGLEIRDIDDYRPTELIESSNGDHTQAAALLLQKIFEEYEVSGRVALYGKVELGAGFGVFDRLQNLIDGVELVGEPENESVLSRARATKDAQEVERIREMGKITTAVVGDVVEYLTSHEAKDGILVNREGELLTIGEVKRRINLWLAMRGAEDPEGNIFSIGHDAGVPHSAGQADQPLELGKTIIFDLFPCEIGGGYFYDFTRTWCLGWASDEAEALYQDVLEVYHSVFEQLKVDSPCRDFQIMTCEQFEARNHPTVRSAPGTTDGYVHSLAHGIGLAVHEVPSFSHIKSNHDTLAPGTVFTFEPGLYYPERGAGVRIEDTVWATPEGEFEILAEFPKDLVLKIPGA
ncbi:MAG: M24 family metallopeptidase [Anaerolineales bacterium]